MTIPRDSRRIPGYLRSPHGRRPPAVVLVHGGQGIPADTRRTTDALASAGMTALVIQADARLSPDEPVDVDYLRSSTFHRRWMDDVRAGFEWLDKNGLARDERVGLVGFCGGGMLATWLATEWSAVAAVVTLHAAPRFPPERNSRADPKPDLLTHAPRLRCPIQLHYGKADPYTPAADVEELRRLLADNQVAYELHMYDDCGHGWCDPESPTYRPSPARLATERLVNFVTQHLTDRD